MTLIGCQTKPKYQQLISKSIANEVASNQFNEFSGVIDPGGEKLVWSFSITSKGNGVLTIGQSNIRLYDCHDDGIVFENWLLENHLEDVNSDGYQDLVLNGTVIIKDERGEKVISEKAISLVFYYHQNKRKFIPNESNPYIYYYYQK